MFDRFFTTPLKLSSTTGYLHYWQAKENVVLCKEQCLCTYLLVSFEKRSPKGSGSFYQKNLTKVKCEASKKKNIQWYLFYFIIKKQILQSDTTCCVKQFRERIQFSIQFTRIFWSSNKLPKWHTATEITPAITKTEICIYFLASFKFFQENV